MKTDFRKVIFICSLCRTEHTCTTIAGYYSKKETLRKGKQTFCSKECRNKSIASSRKIYPKKVGECLRCKKDIIIESADRINSRLGYRMYCGKSCKASTENTGRGMSQSQKDLISKIHTTHGDSKKPLFKVWLEIKRRCESEKSTQYKNYGGRGIKISEQWHDFKIFEQWASSSGYVKGLTIERINVDGNYCKENCTWIPQSEQAKNRRPSSEWNFKKRFK